MCDVEGDGGERDSFAEDPANFLGSEDVREVGGEGFVLRGSGEVSRKS